MAISSDCCAFDFLAHFLQIWAACPLPENFSFGRMFPHTLQKCPRYRFFFAIRYTLLRLKLQNPKKPPVKKSLSVVFHKKSSKNCPSGGAGDILFRKWKWCVDHKKEIPPPRRREDVYPNDQISFLIGWFGSSTVSPRSSAFSATMISIIAAAGAIIFAFSIGPYR